MRFLSKTDLLLIDRCEYTKLGLKLDKFKESWKNANSHSLNDLNHLVNIQFKIAVLSKNSKALTTEQLAELGGIFLSSLQLCLMSNASPLQLELFGHYTSVIVCCLISKDTQSLSIEILNLAINGKLNFGSDIEKIRLFFIRYFTSPSDRSQTVSALNTLSHLFCDDLGALRILLDRITKEFIDLEFTPDCVGLCFGKPIDISAYPEDIKFQYKLILFVETIKQNPGLFTNNSDYISNELQQIVVFTNENTINTSSLSNILTIFEKNTKLVLTDLSHKPDDKEFDIQSFDKMVSNYVDCYQSLCIYSNRSSSSFLDKIKDMFEVVCVNKLIKDNRVKEVNRIFARMIKTKVNSNSITMNHLKVDLQKLFQSSKILKDYKSSYDIVLYIFKSPNCNLNDLKIVFQLFMHFKEDFIVAFGRSDQLIDRTISSQVDKDKIRLAELEITMCRHLDWRKEIIELCDILQEKHSKLITLSCNPDWNDDRLQAFIKLSHDASLSSEQQNIASIYASAILCFCNKFEGNISISTYKDIKSIQMKMVTHLKQAKIAIYSFKNYEYFDLFGLNDLLYYVEDMLEYYIYNHTCSDTNCLRCFIQLECLATSKDNYLKRLENVNKLLDGNDFNKQPFIDSKTKTSTHRALHYAIKHYLMWKGFCEGSYTLNSVHPLALLEKCRRIAFHEYQTSQCFVAIQICILSIMELAKTFVVLRIFRFPKYLIKEGLDLAITTCSVDWYIRFCWLAMHFDLVSNKLKGAALIASVLADCDEGENILCQFCRAIDSKKYEQLHYLSTIHIEIKNILFDMQCKYVRNLPNVQSNKVGDNFHNCSTKLNFGDKVHFDHTSAARKTLDCSNFSVNAEQCEPADFLKICPLCEILNNDEHCEFDVEIVKIFKDICSFPVPFHINHLVEILCRHAVKSGYYLENLPELILFSHGISFRHLAAYLYSIKSFVSTESKDDSDDSLAKLSEIMLFNNSCEELIDLPETNGHVVISIYLDHYDDTRFMLAVTRYTKSEHALTIINTFDKKTLYQLRELIDISCRNNPDNKDIIRIRNENELKIKRMMHDLDVLMFSHVRPLICCPDLQQKFTNRRNHLHKIAKRCSDIICRRDVNKFLKSNDLAILPEEISKPLKVKFSKAKTTILLLLNKNIDWIPFESFHSFISNPVIRLLSLKLLKSNPQLPSLNENREIDMRNGAYIINPDGDLNKTKLHTFFDKKNGWKGLLEEKPSLEVLSEMYCTKDVVIYAGHGSGSQYVSLDYMRKICIRSSVLLMGCSSASCSTPGDFEAYGPPFAYIINGCPLLIGTLWNVTDRDTDEFTMEVIEDWIRKSEKRKVDFDEAYLSIQKAKQKCRFKYLNGNAFVCYGLPISIAKRN
ncbi:hypothetical protein GJ496_005302 [Pomphorhynchus laevis]|nr:hypothetical protein GJ496_005302 [Pomphorhynchus laevis]